MSSSMNKRLSMTKITNWLEDLMDLQVSKIKKEKSKLRKNHRDVILEVSGLKDFYREKQPIIDDLYNELNEIYIGLEESGAITSFNFHGVKKNIEYLVTKGLESKDLEHFDSFNYDSIQKDLDKLETRRVEIKDEWKKLIANVKSRKTVKKAVDYLLEEGFDLELLYDRYKPEPMLPATKINKNKLFL